jgi:WD40 repeat protein
MQIAPIATVASTMIPLDVLIDHILPFAADRSTWNAIALTCREVFRTIRATDDDYDEAPKYEHQRSNRNAAAETTASAVPYSSSLSWPWPQKIQLPIPEDFGVVSCVAFSSANAESDTVSAPVSSAKRCNLSLMACGSFFRIDLFESLRGHVMSFENLQGAIKSIAFSSLIRPSDDVGCPFRYMVGCSGGSNPRLWRISDADCSLSGKRVTRSEDDGLELRLAEAGGGQPSELVFSEDNKSVLCFSQDNSLWECSVITGQCRAIVSLGVSRWRSKMLGVSQKFEHAAMCSAETPGAIQVTTLYPREGETEAWSGARDEAPVSLRHNADVVSDFAFSPCGRHAVMGGDCGILQLWMNIPGGQDNGNAPRQDSPTDRRVYRLRGLESHVMSVAFSPNGKWIAAADWSGLVQVWNIEDMEAGKGDSVGRLDNSNGRENASGKSVPISSVAFTPRSDVLVGTGCYGFVRFWSLQSFSKTSK